MCPNVTVHKMQEKVVMLLRHLKFGVPNQYSGDFQFKDIDPPSSQIKTALEPTVNFLHLV